MVRVIGWTREAPDFPEAGTTLCVRRIGRGAAFLSQFSNFQQRARGKKSKSAAKKQAEYRRNHVNILLRYVVDKKYRQKPKTLATVMKIAAALKAGPLPTW